MVDRQGWTEADIHARASRALQWAYDAGTVHLRTHCDWWEPDAQPLAWNVLRALAHDWADRITLERVSLIPLHLYTDRSAALRLAATVAASGPGALLGGFVHSTNWDPQALRHLLEAAQHHGLNVDLHVDEELHPGAQGLATTAALLKETGFRRPCGLRPHLRPGRTGRGHGPRHARRGGAKPDHAGHAAHHQPAAAGRHHRPHTAPARPDAGEGSPCTRHPGAGGQRQRARPVLPRGQLRPAGSPGHGRAGGAAGGTFRPMERIAVPHRLAAHRPHWHHRAAAAARHGGRTAGLHAGRPLGLSIAHTRRAGPRGAAPGPRRQRPCTGCLACAHPTQSARSLA